MAYRIALLDDESLQLQETAALARNLISKEGLDADVVPYQGAFSVPALAFDAYLLDMMAAVLENQGITGYLYTDSGCSIWLESGDTRYTVYGADGAAGTVKWPSPSAFCQFTAYPLQESAYGYYRVGETLRHPFVDPVLGAPREVLMTASLAGGRQDLTSLAYELAVLCMQADQAGVESRIAALPEDVFYAYLYQGEGAELTVKPGAEMSL